VPPLEEILLNRGEGRPFANATTNAESGFSRRFYSSREKGGNFTTVSLKKGGNRTKKTTKKGGKEGRRRK